MSNSLNIRFIHPQYVGQASRQLPEHFTDYVGSPVFEDNTLKTVLFEGGYIDATDGRRHFYITDHQGNIRAVTDATGTVEQTNDYTPFGSEFDAAATGTNPGLDRRYGGKEKDATLPSFPFYDFEARMYYPAYARFTTMDPLAEKYYSISPYAYCAGNPVNLVDPDGKRTLVFINSDGNYEVVDVDLSNDDYGIYLAVLDESGDYQWTDHLIGYTVSLYSYVDDDNVTPIKGAVINSMDYSGLYFYEDMITNRRSLPLYMLRANKNHQYDFKRTGGGRQVRYTDKQQYYRGMPLYYYNGHIYYATARDIGNIVAGYYAAEYGITWDEARNVFDWLNGSVEPLVSQKAQLLGYTIGAKLPYNERITRRNRYCLLIGISNVYIH